MTADPRRAAIFHYLGFEVEPAAERVVCRYRLDDREFREVVTIPSGGDWTQPAVTEAARLVFLLCGVSYYKAGAPPIVDLGDTAVTDTERAFLTEYYVQGLGEFAYRNGLDLTDLRIEGPRLRRNGPTEPDPVPGRPLIPFGGGLDSLVTVELVRERTPDAALFVVNRPGDRFAAIEEPAAVTGLPVVRAERLIDEQVLRSRELGFLNGHVPVTGVISAIAVLAAVLERRDAVVMSNEWSASSATLEVAGRAINHQYSKSRSFEAGLRAVLRDAVGGAPDYFSLLRSRSELWIAERFAQDPRYLHHFRSCNRAFYIDPALRLDHWCGVCDKCCFIDLVLAPYVDPATLGGLFPGGEPLRNPELSETFRRLLGLVPDAKPWECVGDVVESRVAARQAAARPDRTGPADALLAALVAESVGFADPGADVLLRPLSDDFVPDRYASDARLV